MAAYRFAIFTYRTVQVVRGGKRVRQTRVYFSLVRIVEERLAVFANGAVEVAFLAQRKAQVVVRRQVRSQARGFAKLRDGLLQVTPPPQRSR